MQKPPAQNDKGSKMATHPAFSDDPLDHLPNAGKASGHFPGLKSRDPGVGTGMVSKYATTDIGNPSVVPTEHSKSQRPGFSQKYHVTAAQEPDEVSALRKKAGWKTAGTPDQIGYPAGDQRDRLVDDSADVKMVRKSTRKGQWGGC